MATMPAPSTVLDLVERFDRSRTAYESSEYKEEQLRSEFLNPFFTALGWDVENRKGSSLPYREVIFEPSLKVGDETKAPDYCFRCFGFNTVREFFVEAKKPAVKVSAGSAPARQLRSYAWSHKLPLSILTNFAELAIYDCRRKPLEADSAATGLINLLPYTAYPDRWNEIASVFSPEAIRQGSFDKYIEDTLTRKGVIEVDDAFLAEIERWRNLLARNIALRNPRLGTPENATDLNSAVQMTIDRIIFLRNCEDRGVSRNTAL